MQGHILVPLDGSAFGEEALPMAVAVARRNHSALTLVKVHVPPAPPAKGVFDTMLDDAALEAEGRYLRGLAEFVRTRHALDVDVAVLRGDVAPALQSYVRAHDIGLVIMTSHGRGGLSRAWLGSVADALVRNVDVPVLIVRPGNGQHGEEARRVELNHILIPLDGSALSEQAVAQARAFGAPFNARYTLLQIVAPPASLAGPVEAPLIFGWQELEQLRSRSLEYLDAVASPLREQGLLVDTVAVVQSQSAPGILEEAAARQVDLIVMATHGRGGYRRVALGSVADKVLRGASVPVLMFRADGALRTTSVPMAHEAFI